MGLFSKRKKKTSDILDPSQVDEHLKLLKAFTTLYDEATTFKANDIVQWKPDLKNRRYPLYNQPMMVSFVHDKAKMTNSDADDIDFGEPLDIEVVFYSIQHRAFFRGILNSHRLKHFPK